MIVTALIGDREWEAFLISDRSGPLSLRLYEMLHAKICRFELEPFQMISEASLSETLGVSRQPAREALVRLAGQGLVEILPQRGTRVAPLRLADLEKSQFMREALEVAMLRRAMENPDRTSLVQTLRNEVTLQHAYFKIGDTEKLFASDEAFHSAIAVFANCTAVLEDLQRIKVHMNRFRRLMVTRIEQLDVVIDQHSDIIDAIERGDTMQAEARLLTHLRRIFEYCDEAQERFPDYFEPAPGQEKPA